jgi:putative spermidine/putrescine transport system permease protein
VEEFGVLTLQAGIYPDSSPGERGWRVAPPKTIGVWPLLAALAVFFVAPAVTIITNSVTEPAGAGLSNFRQVLADPTFARFVVNTLRTALIVSAITGAVGYFYAYAMYRSGSLMRAFLMNCALLPFWTSLLVRSFAWTVILRDTGIVNWALMRMGIVDAPIGMLRTPFAVTLGMAQILLPFTIFPAYASMIKFDPDLLRAARSLGAGPVKAFWQVFFPQTRSGLVAGLLLVFVLALGYYITPVLLGGPGDQPVAVLIDAQVTRQLNWGVAGSMSAVVTLAVLVFLAAGWRVVSKIFPV